MIGWFDVDWSALLLPSTPLLEIFVRGSAAYLTLFALLRFVLKRQAGVVGITDLLVVVLIADAIQNAMSGDSHSVTDGILLVATIVFWSYALDWLGYHFAPVGRFVHPSPLPLVKDGKMLRRNMRREFITEEELMSTLRKQGAESVEDVKAAYMEGDGHISVITYSGQKSRADQPTAL
jgi:uncharacterized membrane protein YcaP (DUF421 family)